MGIKDRFYTTIFDVLATIWIFITIRLAGRD